MILHAPFFKLYMINTHVCYSHTRASEQPLSLLLYLALQCYVSVIHGKHMGSFTHIFMNLSKTKVLFYKGK